MGPHARYVEPENRVVVLRRQGDHVDQGGGGLVEFAFIEKELGAGVDRLEVGGVEG